MDDEKPHFTVRVESVTGPHTQVTIFNRGGWSGTLVILSQDVEELRRRLSDS